LSERELRTGRKRLARLPALRTARFRKCRRRFFDCSRLHAGLTTSACSEMWRAANEGRSERYTACRSCFVGATHAGVSNASRSPIRGALVCARCARGATRLIHRNLCVSCFNREREMIKGRNAAAWCRRNLRHSPRDGCSTSPTDACTWFGPIGPRAPRSWSSQPYGTRFTASRLHGRDRGSAWVSYPRFGLWSGMSILDSYRIERSVRSQQAREFARCAEAHGQLSWRGRESLAADDGDQRERVLAAVEFNLTTTSWCGYGAGRRGESSRTMEEAPGRRPRCWAAAA